MKKRVFENGIYYVLVGDYYVPEQLCEVFSVNTVLKGLL